MTHWIGILCLIAASPHPESNDIKDGSLLFVSGGNRAVRLYTQSPYSHVAIIFKDCGRLWVYESDRYLGVRRFPLDQLGPGEAQERIWIAQPKAEYTREQVNRMLAYLKSQLGREFSLRSFIIGSPAKGIHCAELVTNTLMIGNVCTSENPCVVTPADIARTFVGQRYGSLVEYFTAKTLSACQMLPRPFATLHLRPAHCL